MLKKLNVLLVLVAVVGSVALVLNMRRGTSHERGEVVVSGRQIRIYGQGYTLERLAQVIGDADILTYDPTNREATALASLIIHGSLLIGDRENPDRHETLILDTAKCGDLLLEVAPEGTLEVYNATVTTKSQQLTADNCSLGYGFFVDGTFRGADSTFLYMSGSESKVARRTARVTFDRVDFQECDGSAFQTEEADGAQLSIRNCKFWCAGRTGALIVGKGAHPVTLRNCSLRGEESDLAIRGAGAAARLVDCTFQARKLAFYHRQARVEVQWSVNVKVVEKGTEKPVSGATVVATGVGPDPEVVEGVTDGKGVCPLVLTEFVGTAEFPYPREGKNVRTPHRIEVRRGGAALGVVPAYKASMPGGGDLLIEVDARE